MKGGSEVGQFTRICHDCIYSFRILLVIVI